MVAMISFSRLAASIVRSHSACHDGAWAAGTALSIFGAAAGLLSPCAGAAVGAVGWPDPAGAVGLAEGAAQAASISTVMQRPPRRKPRLITGMILLRER